MTLGSLLNESIDRLEALDIISDTTEDDEGLVKGGTIDEEDHIPTNEESMRGVDGPGAGAATSQHSVARSMQNRGLPYFEEMVENSRLGRIKRQKGGHTSRDGRTTVQWEVVEIGGDDGSTPMETSAESGGGGNANKRQKTDG